MENLSDLVTSGKSGLQKLWEKLPGIKGYEKLEDARDTDKIVRETIAARFEEQWLRVQDVEKTLAKGAGLIYLSDADSAAKKIRLFIDRIKTAAYGYAGASDAIKVDESVLSQLYDYDLYLFSLADSVKGAVDNLEEAALLNDGVDKAIAGLNQIAGECIIALNRRSEVKIGTQNS